VLGAIACALFSVPLAYVLLTAPEGPSVVGLGRFACRRDLVLALGLWAGVEVYGYMVTGALKPLGVVEWSVGRGVPRVASTVELVAFGANVVAWALHEALVVALLAARLPIALGSKYAAPPCIALALALTTIGDPSAGPLYALCRGLAYGATFLVFPRAWPLALASLGSSALHAYWSVA
jgi:hypothetical protein